MHISGNVYAIASTQVSRIDAYFKPHELSSLLCFFLNVSEQYLRAFLNDRFYFTDREHTLFSKKKKEAQSTLLRGIHW